MESEGESTNLKVHNILGWLVRTLMDEAKFSGIYEWLWDGKDKNGGSLCSRVYPFCWNAGELCQSKKMVLIKIECN